MGSIDWARGSFEDMDFDFVPTLPVGSAVWDLSALGMLAEVSSWPKDSSPKRKRASNDCSDDSDRTDGNDGMDEIQVSNHK